LVNSTVAVFLLLTALVIPNLVAIVCLMHNRAEQRLATGMAKEDVTAFLAALASAAEPVNVHFMWRPQLADPADELVLEAAVNGRTSVIVTHNVRDFLPAARDFEIEVITPSVMLQRMRE
jgi:predicted nucleic acid-binding protein